MRLGSGTLGPQTAAALGTVTGLEGNRIVIKVITSGTETVAVTGTVNGQASASIMFKSIATGVLHSSVNMDDGTYFLENCPFDVLTFTGSATSDTKTVHWEAST